MSPQQQLFWLPIIAVLALAAVYFNMPRKAHGEAHHSGHPPQDMALHEKFYSNWKRHKTNGDCCDNRDCYPTRAVFDEALGLWKAQRREDGKMLIIPRDVYDPDHPELERESPDGRAHLCAPIPVAPGRAQYILPNPVQELKHHYLGRFMRVDHPRTLPEVYCFTPGTGM